MVERGYISCVVCESTVFLLRLRCGSGGGEGDATCSYYTEVTAPLDIVKENLGFICVRLSTTDDMSLSVPEVL